MKKKQLIYFERAATREGPVFLRIGRQHAVWLLSQKRNAWTSRTPLVLDCSGEIPRLIPNRGEARDETWGYVFRSGFFVINASDARPLGLPNFWLDELGNMIGPDGEIVLKVEEET